MFNTFDISVSGLRAERIRFNLIANNVANMHSTRDEFGNRVAYRRRLAVFEPGAGDSAFGVHVSEIVESQEALRLQYEPGHPDAIGLQDFFKLSKQGISTGERLEQFKELSEKAFERLVDSRIGYVEYPNVDPAREMADAVLASRAYEANVAVIAVTKTLIGQTLRLIA